MRQLVPLRSLASGCESIAFLSHPGAKRMDCGGLAPAFKRVGRTESAGKPGARQTLRAIRPRARPGTRRMAALWPNLQVGGLGVGCERGDLVLVLPQQCFHFGDG